MSIRIVSTHPSHTHAEVCVCVFWWSPHVWKFDPNSISVSPWIEGLGCVCTCVSVCAPVCSRYWSFDPGSPWRQWLRQHHAGDKIDVYSTRNSCRILIQRQRWWRRNDRSADITPCSYTPACIYPAISDDHVVWGDENEKGMVSIKIPGRKSHFEN